VLCHLEDAGSKALFVCSQADRIAMNPAGGLRFAGLASSYMYFGGTLKKLGVRADFVRIGDHKGAAEQYTLPAGSPSPIAIIKSSSTSSKRSISTTSAAAGASPRRS